MFPAGYGAQDNRPAAQQQETLLSVAARGLGGLVHLRMTAAARAPHTFSAVARDEGYGVTLRPLFKMLLCVATMPAVGGCAYEIAYDPAYVPSERPPYIAEGKILIVMAEEQQQFVYTSSPDSETGDFTTLTVPMGAIVRDIAQQVFTSCFAQGVDFAPERTPDGDYVIALEGNMEEFIYSYTKIIEQGFEAGDEEEADVDAWIIPEVEIAFAVRAFDRRGTKILDKTYGSGVTAGEGYRVTSHPEERINETLHATLHALMLQVAADIKPLLIGECTVTDIA
jgi:hypothetical protein